jgi:hypothetical protein
MCLVGQTTNQVQIHKLFFALLTVYPALAFTVIFICFDKMFKDLPKEFSVDYYTTFKQLQDFRIAFFALAIMSMFPMIFCKYYNIHQERPRASPLTTNIA